ncbi:S1-like domain-containing RNA-binding protein [Peptoniphilus sp. GNH]|nr:YitL family protein [Clostridiales bacterium KA00134]UHR02087.1 S1-like domain-containing RNA-binding protein [Peptoniphilus sp. GNH]
MKLGKIQKLKVLKKENGRAILEDEKEKIALTREESKNVREGQTLEVFVYNDKEGFSATLKKPLAEVGELKKLTLVAKSKYGYFVDIGIDKDIFLPFKEAVGRPIEGESYLLYLYEDRSKRICATMNIKKHLSVESPYKVNDNVEGLIYGIDHKIGAFVAVDGKYDGLILQREIKGIHRVGEEVRARVQRILQDGKLTLTFREKAYKQMGIDAEMLLDLIKENKGILELSDKSSPEEILEETGLSKKAFKRALGNLYKEKLVRLEDDRVIFIGKA